MKYQSPLVQDLWNHVRKDERERERGREAEGGREREEKREREKEREGEGGGYIKNITCSNLFQLTA